MPHEMIVPKTQYRKWVEMEGVIENALPDRSLMPVADHLQGLHGAAPPTTGSRIPPPAAAHRKAGD